MARSTWWRRLVATAIAHDLTAFVVPGAEVARAHGLDLAAAGLRLVPTPRHASVLVVVGGLPEGLTRAAAVAYAQMPRPRAVLAMGTRDIAPVPAPDVVTELDQQALSRGVATLRGLVAGGGFDPDAASFDVPAVRVETEYTCPMHPEVVRDAPGRCPKCGMDLVPRERVGGASAHGATDHATMEHAPMEHGAPSSGPTAPSGPSYTCPMHPEVVRDAPGRCPKCGMDLVPRERAGATSAHGATDHAPMEHAPMEHGTPSSGPAASSGPSYTCPMHPEVVRDAPGRCPKCGMDLVPRERAEGASAHGATDHATMDHASMEHGAPSSGPNEASGPSYTCPMHPEVVRDAPGRCPKCGMDLVPRERAGATSAHGATDHATMEHASMEHGAPSSGPNEASGPSYTCPMHPEVVRDAPGRCPKCGMDLVPRERAGGASAHGARDHAPMEHGVPSSGPTASSGPSYTCPMHPEVVRDAPGRCPKCGMDLVPRDAPASTSADGATEHRGMDHAATRHQAGAGHDGGNKHEGMDHDMGSMGGFMSMVAITKDLPRSPDGLPMDWLDAPFGPLFPGLPGGLGLALTLDGDDVAGVALDARVASRGLAATWPGAIDTFPDRLARLDPEAEVAYRVLALRAIESATVAESDHNTARAWIGALERERALSHLNWLASWGQLMGTPWLADRAAALRLALSRVAGMDGLAPVAASIGAFVRRVERMPLLRQRLEGIGAPSPEAPVPLRGPVSRASAAPVDARSTEPAYLALGFEPCAIAGGDALARMRVRLAELQQSLALIRAAGTLGPPEATRVPAASAGDGAGKTLEGRATLETPRGAASLTVQLAGGAIGEVVLDLPSVAHAGLLDAVATGRELAGALTGIASLDLSPWELGA